MTDQSAAPSGGSDITVVSLPADAPAEFSSPQSVMNYLAEQREKKPTAESAEEATAETELSGEDNPESPQQETTAEDQEIEPAKPAIEPPKSWTKDLHEHWNNLDPILQERIVARDREDQAAIKRAFNEAADERKAIKAEREAAEQARQQYETKTKDALEVLEREQLRDFPDIKTMADVAKMAMEDPFRKIQWDVHQDQIRATAWEAQQAEQRKTAEHQSSWNKFVHDESAAFAEAVPEYTAKKSDYDKKAAEVLREIGFTDAELNRLASGEEKIPLFDRRIQRLLFDRIKLSEIRSAPKAVVSPKLPPVQRPGTSRPSGAAASERTQALDKALTQSGDLKTAFALLQARRGGR
jgi:hypothetical protein